MKEIQWHQGFKRRRELHQIPLQVMAELMEVSEQYLEEFEKGNTNLNVYQLEKACLLFDCSLAQLSEKDNITSFNAIEFNCSTLESIIKARKIANRLHFIENA